MRNKGWRTIFKDICKVETLPELLMRLSRVNGRKHWHEPGSWVWKACSFHYLLTVLQRNNEAMAQGVQVSEGFLQMTQGVRIGHRRVPSFLHVLVRIPFPRLLNKMFDCLHSLVRHLLAYFHRQLYKKGMNNSETSQPYAIYGIFNKAFVRQKEQRWHFNMQL